MSDASALDHARLTVLLDLRQPLAYLALKPTIELGREEGLEINWLPVRVPALKAPTPVGSNEDRGVRHRRSRALALARTIETYGAAQGLVLRDYYRDPDPSAVHVAWLFVREHAPQRLEAFLEEVFRAYWAVELDPGDEHAVGEKLAGLGLDPERFERWRRASGLALLGKVEDELAERGMAIGAPAYWIDGEFFWGGQHLEMIRGLLRASSSLPTSRA